METYVYFKYVIESSTDNTEPEKNLNENQSVPVTNKSSKHIAKSFSDVVSEVLGQKEDGQFNNVEYDIGCPITMGGNGSCNSDSPVSGYDSACCDDGATSVENVHVRSNDGSCLLKSIMRDDDDDDEYEENGSEQELTNLGWLSDLKNMTNWPEIVAGTNRNYLDDDDDDCDEMIETISGKNLTQERFKKFMIQVKQ